MRALIVATLALAVVGCGYVGEQTAPYRPPQPPVSHRDDAGPFLYKRDCAWCHGDSAEGTRYGPGLRGGENGPALTDFVLRTGRMPLTSAEEPMRRRPSIYTSDEIDALVRYMTSIAGEGPPIPEPRSERADIGHGGELYLENCAACHSTTGIGGALTQGSFPGPVERRTGAVAPGLLASKRVEIAEAIRTGPGAMPAFGAGVLRDRDVDAIVRYVIYLQEPEDKGGAAIGRIGPVAEGAVGWIVGLGLLLALSYWIGSRAARQ